LKATVRPSGESDGRMSELEESDVSRLFTPLAASSTKIPRGSPGEDRSTTARERPSGDHVSPW